MPTVVAEALGLKPAEAIDYLKRKNAVTSTHWTDLWRDAHARSFMVAGAATQALVEDFHTEVLKAIENGTTLADFRKEFDTLVQKHGWSHTGSAGWRASIIYETNLSMAYSAGQYEQMTRPATLAVFPYWQYVHTTSAHPRQQHLAWAGLTLRADDPWWDTHYPPNGWRCKCGVRPVMEHELERMGKNGPDIAPPIVTRTWINPKTGEPHQVPIGISPGFDYNVGKAGLATKPPEAGLVRPHRMLRAEGVGSTRPVAATFDEWADQVLDAGRADGAAWEVGELPASVPVTKGEPREIMLPARRLLHLQRGTKVERRAALPAIDVRNIPSRLAHPDRVLRQKDNGRIVFVFRPSGRVPPGKLGKVVVAIGQKVMDQGDARSSNVVVSAGLVDPTNLSEAEFDTLWER